MTWIQDLSPCTYFGEEAANYSALHIEDWAANENICSDLDRARDPAHPEIVSNVFRRPHCEGHLHFAVSETAAQSPGLIEGGFVAGSHAARNVIASLE